MRWHHGERGWVPRTVCITRAENVFYLASTSRSRTDTIKSWPSQVT